ncbi:MAG: tetraacyldisaccharide 4'-kinase, partial [Acidobacteriota bacterium]|nr:tetraacyldisaccharide 4'-kinase [Acidobacteriota bacterium]
LSRPLLDPLSLLFKAGSYVNLRVKALRMKSFPGLFIISADSLSFGGTGKTPLVMAIGAALREKGARFAIVSRGYRSRYEKQGILVETAHTCEEVGDEPMILKARFPGQDVFIGRDRLSSIAAAAARGNRIIILDDGLQSSHIRKDLSILLVNPAHPYFYLRHFRFLSRRADRVLYYRPTGQGSQPEGQTYDFAITRFMDAAGVEMEIGEASFIAFSALGDNERFAGDMGRYNLAGYRPFPDHHAFSAEDLRSLDSLRREKGAAWMVCTEKDFCKIKSLLAPGVPLLYARNEIQLPRDLIDQITTHAAKKGFI